MAKTLKIFLLILAVLPLWLTIVTLGAPRSNAISAAWKDRINSRLLDLEDRKIQILEILPTRENLSDEDLNQNFELDLSALQPRSFSILTLRFSDVENRLLKVIRLSVKASIQTEVYVATVDLNRDAIVNPSLVKSEWRDVASLKGTPVRLFDIQKGRILRMPIRQSEPLYSTHLSKEQLVSRGDQVRVSVVGQGIVLTITGVAQEAGSKGQTIRVMNTESRKEIFGVVTDLRAVEVQL